MAPKKTDSKPSKRRVFSAGLSSATERSYDTKDSFGGGISYLKKDVKVPTFMCADGDHTMDIIPYIAGENDPNAAEGQPQYVLDIWIHRGVGALQQSYVCPMKNYKKRCPICEKQLAMRRSGEFSDEEIASLSPKRRTMYNVVVWDSKDEIRKGVQIFEISHFFFEKHLAELSKRPKGGGFVVFSDPDEGKTIVFKKKSKGKGNMEFLGHRFEEREDQITDEMLDAALCLDDLIHVPTVSELKKAVEEGFATEEEEKPKKKKPSYKEEEDEDEDDIDSTDEEDDEEEEVKPKKKASSAKKKPPVDDEDDEEADEDDEEADEDEEEEEVKPKKKKRR